MCVTVTANVLFLFLLILFYSFLFVLAQDNIKYDNGFEQPDVDKMEEMRYKPPGTLTFPIGDEEMTNDDVQIEEDVIEDFFGDPFGSDLKKDNTDFHSSCDESSFESPLPPIHCCDEGNVTPTQYCESCNINLAPDGNGVFIKCHNCSNGMRVNVDTSFSANFIQMSPINNNESI